MIIDCEQAARESCPLFPGKFEKLHWSTPYPAKAKGSKEEMDTAFEKAFQALKKRIEKELV